MMDKCEHCKFRAKYIIGNLTPTCRRHLSKVIDGFIKEGKGENIRIYRYEMSPRLTMDILRKQALVAKEEFKKYVDGDR